MIKDIYVNSCQYYKEDHVILIVEGDFSQKTTIIVEIFNLTNKVNTFTFSISNSRSELDLGTYNVGGYEIKVQHLTTAFDVLVQTSDSPRYGFISDFTTDDFTENIKQMNKLHLNLIQFYDWMYRHHELVPNTNIFIDPMGREVDKSIIESKIKGIHDYKMKAIAYGAVYGAEEEYLKTDSDDLMMYNDGKPIMFIDLIGMMDISSNTRWRKHIINEFSKAITMMDFDGIHLDQYGFPKYSSSKTNQFIDLAKEIPSFINDTIESTKNLKEEVIIDFNYVNNWPIDTIRESIQDFSYIEVWAPNDAYNDLARVIREAKLFSNYRQVVIAAYIHPFQGNGDMINKETAALLAMSCIYAQGAYPLLFGEKNGILSDPYYVNYSIYTDDFFKIVRSYQDFIVKYKELLFTETRDISYTFINGINEEIVVKNYPTSSDYKQGTIEVNIHEGNHFKTIHLINLLEQKDPKWNVLKNSVKQHDDIIIEYLIQEPVEGIYFATPDDLHSSLIKLPYEYVKHGQGKAIRFTVPSLMVWSMVYIKI